MTDNIYEFLEYYCMDDVCELCETLHECKFNTEPHNMCDGQFCEGTYEHYLESHIDEILDLACYKAMELQRKVHLLNQQNQDNYEKLCASLKERANEKDI